MQGALFNIKQITLTAQPVKFVLSLCILLRQCVHLSVCVSCLVYPSFQLLEMLAALTVTLIHQCIGALVYQYFGSLMHWCIGALMHGDIMNQCIYVFVHQCISALVYYCIGILMHWCTNALVVQSPPPKMQHRELIKN